MSENILKWNNGIVADTFYQMTILNSDILVLRNKTFCETYFDTL